MLQNLDEVTFLIGSKDIMNKMIETPALEPFSDIIIDFLNEVSKVLMKDSRGKAYSDVITFGFWIRKASAMNLKKRFIKDDNNIHLGRGIAFHIAPSNVPVNFAYSLAAGLLTGNINIIRVPSKDFEQVSIIADAIDAALKKHNSMRAYVALVRYEHDIDINNMFSSICDTRIIWGGDGTIKEIRKSPLPPRSTEVTFSDRYSIAVIDSDEYMKIEDKSIVASAFYNDTYFTDQNACTSPRIVIWLGKQKKEAKDLFWNKLHSIVEKKYAFQPIMAVNKLTNSYLIAAELPGTRRIDSGDNLVVRIEIPQITEELMDYKDNCGYFFEYDCNDILELKPIFDDKRCQTIGVIGGKEKIMKLLKSGVRGIDRVVPIGKTMDFDLIWDGYDLPSSLTRVINIMDF